MYLFLVVLYILIPSDYPNLVTILMVLSWPFSCVGTEIVQGKYVFPCRDIPRLLLPFIM